MKEKDIKIIRHLRNDARIGLTDLSRKTSIPVSTIFDRLKSSHGNLIMKHTTLVDFRHLGYSTKAWVAIKTSKTAREDMKKYLSKHRSVNNVFLINNQHDFLFEVVCKDIKELRDFFEVLEEKFEIIRKDEHLIIEDIEREKFLTELIEL